MSQNPLLQLHIEGQQFWRETLNVVFPDSIPDRKEWASLEDIIKILNIIGKKTNHAFFPQGGGFDVESACASEHERGCLEITFDGGVDIMKPEKLTFFKVNDTLLCSYFKLSLGKLQPSGVYPGLTDYEMVKDTNGHYSDADEDYYSTDDFRIVKRMFKGDIYIFGKGSPYNVAKFSKILFDAYVPEYSKRDLPENEFNNFLNILSIAYKEKNLDPL